MLGLFVVVHVGALFNWAFYAVYALCPSRKALLHYVGGFERVKHEEHRHGRPSPFFYQYRKFINSRDQARDALKPGKIQISG